MDSEKFFQKRKFQIQSTPFLFRNLMVLAPFSVILQIAAFSAVILILSSWFSKKFAVSAEAQMQMQYKMQDLQTRLREAQTNPQLMQELNLELAALMKEMYKKQIIPMCIRSVVFFGFWGLMQVLYGSKYDGFLPFPTTFAFGRTLFFLYLVISFSISILMWLVKFLYRKLKGTGPTQKEEVFIDHARALGSTFNIAPDPSQRQTPDPTQNSGNPTGSQPETSSNSHGIGKSWKDRLNTDS